MCMFLVECRWQRTARGQQEDAGTYGFYLLMIDTYTSMICNRGRSGVVCVLFFCMMSGIYLLLMFTSQYERVSTYLPFPTRGRERVHCSIFVAFHLNYYLTN